MERSKESPLKLWNLSPRSVFSALNAWQDLQQQLQEWRLRQKTLKLGQFSSTYRGEQNLIRDRDFAKNACRLLGVRMVYLETSPLELLHSSLPKD